MARASAAPSFALVSAIRSAVRKGADPAPFIFGVVEDSHPGSLTVVLQGFDDATDVISADFFELMPLQTDDVVVLAHLDGAYCVIARVAGDPVDLAIGVEQLDGFVMQVGAPFGDSDDPGSPEMQIFQAPLPVTYPAGETSLVWTFTPRFGDVPYVFPTVLGPSYLHATASVVTRASATLLVRNLSGGPLDGILTAQAIGKR